MWVGEFRLRSARKITASFGHFVFTHPIVTLHSFFAILGNGIFSADHHNWFVQRKVRLQRMHDPPASLARLLSQ